MTDEQTDERSVDDRSKKQVGIFLLLFFMVKNTILAIELNRKERKGDTIFPTAMNGL